MKKLFKKPAKPSPYTHPEPIDDTPLPSHHQQPPLPPPPPHPSPPLSLPFPARSPTADAFPLRSPPLPTPPRSSTPDHSLPPTDSDYSWAVPGDYAYIPQAPNGHPYMNGHTPAPSPSAPSDGPPLPPLPLPMLSPPPAQKKRGIFSTVFNTAPPPSNHGIHTAPASLGYVHSLPPPPPTRIRHPDSEVPTMRGDEEPYPVSFPGMGNAPAPFGIGARARGFFGGGGAKAPAKDEDVLLPLPADPPPGTYLPSPNGTDATVRPSRQRSESRADGGGRKGSGDKEYTSSRESQKEKERDKSPAEPRIVFEKEKENDIKGWRSMIPGSQREKDAGLNSWESRTSAYASEKETRRDREARREREKSASAQQRVEARKEAMTGMSSWESRRSTKSTRSTGGGGKANRERERERDVERERARAQKEMMALGEAGAGPDGAWDIVHEIGWLTANSSEDWPRLLDVCERVRDSEAVAKEAAKAIRKDIKYGEDTAKLSAARIWAIMLRNCGEHFIALTASRKFMDTVDIVIKDSHSPVVRDRLKHVLAMAAYTYPTAGETEGRNGHKGGFLALWKKVRPMDDAERGYPFDDADTMFNPPAQPSKVLPAPRPSPIPVGPSPLSFVQPPQTQVPGGPKRGPKVISPEEDIRRLFEECGLGTWNAQLLHAAVAFAKPEETVENVLMREWYEKCVASQEIISSQLEWAAAQAGRSRELAGPRKSPPLGGGVNGAASPPTQLINILPASPDNGSRTPSPPQQRPLPVPPAQQGQMQPVQLQEGETIEERLLANLLQASDQLAGAIKDFEDLERMLIVQNEEKEVEERSRKETRLDRNALHYLAPDGTFYTEPYSRHGGGSGSGRHTPSSQPSSRPSSPALMQRDSSAYQDARRSPNFSPQHQTHSLPNPIHPALAPPPHHPNGPRRIVRSRSPSPEVNSLGSRTASNGSFPSSGGAAGPYSRQLSLDSNVTGAVEVLADGEDGSSVPSTPIEPSPKALGKRPMKDRTVDEDAFNPHDWANDPNVPPTPPEEEEVDPLDPLKVELGIIKPVRYAYDAAAERERERMMELKQSSRHAVATY